MVSGPIPFGHQSEKFDDPHMYQSVVATLQYITLTHLEISYSVNKACQFMHSPTILHWQLVKRILHYLKGTLSHGLLLKGTIDLKLYGFVDVVWASDLDDWKSTSRFCIFFALNLVTWDSKKQSIISRSSMEVEYWCLPLVATKMV
ncbi:uncharacterized mitochondrial protein AtMg00810-like [Benincasa hispida]|uniref:uncharacterized mitochondrial protein AtMg00810-like n=1 Tax=Benincasa hispida TaxID=102211 RepID=UPI0018FF55BD|nr:uncharacterized mitochondrial protein AtMg00810-like [Benincasa hispida]